MELSKQQGEAADAVGKWLAEGESSPQTFYLAGYAGTGKTTIAKHLAGQQDGEVAFMAFTGKAASVLTRKGCSANTIHSAIYRLQKPDAQLMSDLRFQLKSAKGETEEIALRKRLVEVSRPRFILNEDSFVKDLDLIIIDEVSMVGKEIGADLLSFGKKVLVLGDPGQLPPIGGTGFFTAGPPDFLLTDIHRQAADSTIIRMATLVRQGHGLKRGKYGIGGEVISRNDSLGVKADQFIVGLNRTRAYFNEVLRDSLGFNNPGQPEPGDKLICLRNNRDKGLFNGSQWRVEAVEDKTNWLELKITDWDEIDTEKPLEVSCHPFGAELKLMPDYDRRRFEEFDFGYAITCHKSQGSQWGSVFVQNEAYAFREFAKEWLYTAITRAENSVVVAI